MGHHPALTPQARRGVAAGSCVGLLLLLSLLMTRASGLPWSGPSPEPAQLNMLVTQCQQDMLSQSCSVMQRTPAEPTVARPAEDRVFVAGLGAVDGEVLAQLRDAGQAMCTLLRQRCEQDWSGAACRTARTLYGKS